MSAKSNICQSCGMSLKQFTDFGTYSDGSINTDYCYHCYQDGAFTDQNISLEEKIAKNIAVAQRLGISRAEAKKQAHVILPSLKRWRKKRDSNQVFEDV